MQRKLARRIGAHHLQRSPETVPIAFARVGFHICKPNKAEPRQHGAS